MNLYIAPTAPQQREKMQPLPRGVLQKAKTILLPRRPNDRMPDHLYRMLNILYHFEGIPEVMTCDGCKALVFSQNSRQEEKPEFPVLFLNQKGNYVVYSVKELKLNEAGWVYCIETMTHSGWSEEWFEYS